MGKRFNCFVLFCGDHRKKMLLENKDRSNSEVTAMLAQRWRNLENKEKEYYKRLAKIKKAVSEKKKRSTNKY